jgi:hypothetical protein
MQTIPNTFRKHDADFTLVSRQGDVAIYARKSAHMTAFEYEVVIVRRVEAREVFGKQQPAKEILPSDSDFGRYAWSANSWSRAEEIFEREIAGRNFAGKARWNIEPLEPWTKATTGE